MLSTVLNILFPVRQQKSTTTISKIDVMQMFKNVDDLKLSDTRYKLVDAEQLQIFLKRNKTDKREYKHPEHDCDDFSYILFGDVTRWDSDLAFGIAWVLRDDGKYHSLNVFIATDKKIYFVEPQTDDVFLVPDNWDIRFVMM